MDYVIDPDQVEAWPLHPDVMGKILVDGQNMTAMVCVWGPKTRFALHSHPHEQLGYCLQGEAVVTVDGQDHLIEPGKMYYVPSNAPHAWRNDGDEPAVLIDVYSPVREDLLRRRFEQKTYE